MQHEGIAITVGNDVDTDAIIPARYLTTWDADVLAQHCLEDWDESFPRRLQPGIILVAGKNFGCGSSREHAPLAIKGAGVACVIAHSFARIFYRNAVNIGLPVLECPEAAAHTRDGDTLFLDLKQGTITNRSQGHSWQAQAFPPFMQELIAAGGLIPYVRKRVMSGA